MTVIGVFGVTQRAWRGYEDPGLPVGMWFAQGSTVGDASGGDMTVRLQFIPAEQPVSGRWYNLEQLELQATTFVAVNGFLRIQNLGNIGPVGLVNRLIHLRLEPVDDGTSNALGAEPGVKLPLFMGRPGVPTLNASLDLGIQNLGAGESLTATAQGYIWQPRSLMAEGGLRRPIDSLYGR